MSCVSKGIRQNSNHKRTYFRAEHRALCVEMRQSQAKKEKKGVLVYGFRLLRENRNNSPSIAATGMAMVVNSGMHLPSLHLYPLCHVPA
jgi:hypothetical protein